MGFSLVLTVSSLLSIFVVVIVGYIEIVNGRYGTFVSSFMMTLNAMINLD